MKYAAITPPYIGHLLMWSSGTRGYHFALGQELLRDGVYRGLVKMSTQRGGFLIVDNGAAEDDTPPFESIVRVANQAGADEIILPDVLKDGGATVVGTCDQRNTRMVPPRQRMIVPQGRSWDEWLWCWREIDRLLGGEYATIGIPKHLETLEGGRAQAIHTLGMNGAVQKHHIHMLGIWDDAHKEIQAAYDTFWGVRGIDSGLAVACAQCHMRVVAGGARRSLQWTPETEATPAEIELAAINMQTIDSWCRRRPVYANQPGGMLS